MISGYFNIKFSTFVSLVMIIIYLYLFAYIYIYVFFVFACLSVVLVDPKFVAGHKWLCVVVGVGV